MKDEVSQISKSHILRALASILRGLEFIFKVVESYCRISSRAVPWPDYFNRKKSYFVTFLN